MMKTLVLTKDQLKDRIIRFHRQIDGPELTCSMDCTLKDLDFKNNTKNCLYLKFVRAYAFLDETEFENLI